MNKKTKELKQKLEKYKELSTKDPLTGVYNRRGFKERVLPLIKDVLATKNKEDSREHFFVDALSLAFCDIDNFKRINDEFGHKEGDRILKELTQVLLENIRGIDILGRWGGEEFILALVGSTEEAALSVVETLRGQVKESIVTPQDKPVSVSFGVAEFKQDMDFEELIERADRAMYKAKESGKDRCVGFSEI